MKLLSGMCVLMLVVAPAVSMAADGKSDDLKKPLMIASQGSFFVGRREKGAACPPTPRGYGGGDITINQMYVQYQTPRTPSATRPSSWCTAAA